MAEQQLDWLGLDDKRAQARRLLERAAERIGVVELAHQLDEDPSTVRNQLARRDGKRPSGDLLILVFLLDDQFRRDLAALNNVADLSPAEALREIAVLASARFGVADKEAVQLVLARVRREP